MVELKLFKCKKCGSVVVKLNKRGCPPSCCGEPMQEMHPNETDGAKEKHVPAVEVAGDVIKVQVGSVAHPMLEEHYIGFIALRTDKGVQFKFLNPGDEPVAEFKIADGEEAIAAYEYCNLHGFWKANI